MGDCAERLPVPRKSVLVTCHVPGTGQPGPLICSLHLWLSARHGHPHPTEDDTEAQTGEMAFAVVIKPGGRKEVQAGARPRLSRLAFGGGSPVSHLLT